MLWWTMRRLKSADPKARARAAVKLGESRDSRALALLEAALGDEDASVRAAVAAALGRTVHPRSGTLLATALQDRDPEVRAAAAAALVELAPVFQLGIAAMLQKEGPRGGAMGIGFLKGLREATASALTTALGDSDSRVRAMAAVALGEIWNQQPARAVGKALDRDLSPATQGFIMFIHIELRDVGEEIVQRLQAALGDADAAVQSAAAEALRKLEKS
jgi:HEAT repeat protein